MQLKEINYKKSIQNVCLFFALLISFWIPQYKFVLSMFISFWLLFSILQTNFKLRLLENYSKKKIIFFLIQICFFLLIIFGYFYSKDKEYAAEIIVKKLSFLIFPVLFIFSGKQFSDKKNLFLKLFVLGNIVASVICIVHAIYQSVDYNEGSLFFNSINEDENNYFRYSLLSVFHHPAYFSMYIVFSIAVLFYLKSNDVLFNTNKKKVLFYLIVGFFLVMVYFLSSRAGIFTAFILIVWKILLYVKKHKRLLIKLFSVVIIIAGIIVLSQNSRIIRTYYDVKNTFIKGKEYESYPARLVLWESAVKVTEENFWLGTGTGDAQEKLSEIIKKGNFKNDEISFLNAHNQFLETFMSSGLIGFLILLMIVLYSFYYAVKAKNELFILFLILIVINLIFESMLNTIAGIVFLCYFLNYFIFVHSVPVKK